ncbi:unnamed protein product [Spirodela intermedia]|uniref:type I protein arginine methyltransferase n=1 Tax=Spirodela intermedia TaxID=51605 RepID=A0A7I8IA16_SPIIN|nr:unnamed protein product [Spirodela intermedia]CAA6654430.1 unnamed protein product [Spirodela intermedia]
MAAGASDGAQSRVHSEEMVPVEEFQDEEDEEEQVEGIELLCLFCEARFLSSDDLFAHCRAEHSFDFHAIRRDLELDFYGCFKLINYVRAQVAKNRCRSWDDRRNWDDDSYLKPFMPDDALLRSLPSDDEGEEYSPIANKEELIKELMCENDISDICTVDGDLDSLSFEVDSLNIDGVNQSQATIENGYQDNLVQTTTANGVPLKQDVGTSQTVCKDKRLRVHFSNASARNIKSVNEDYFGSYGSFGIHREMISDKVRTETYRNALTNNPSLLNGATVLDVGCGTGILSLFAAQAGASKVIAVDASEKMATVASQIARDNGLLLERRQNGDSNECSGVISVVQGMIEELDTAIQVPPNSIDVLVSEWMGYCLLYESMLSSVIYARDHWLKPGGAILPDIATIFVAGFGKGATSFPFWENVYGFDMSTIGREVVDDAAKLPIVDVVDSRDIVTETARLKGRHLRDSLDPTSGVTWCYGIVLWFDTPFSSRFCKESPYTLSTSPYSPKTHWYQTIFTFSEPIALASSDAGDDSAAPIGTERCPALKVGARISIGRAVVHRSIDISLEIAALGVNGRRRSLPVQIFNL